MRKRLGYIKRGVAGYLQVKFEQIPAIPDTVSKEVIGTSVEGRDIECYSFGSGEKKILFSSAIHGNEVGTVALARAIIDHLFKTPEVLDGITVFIIPLSNPDGYSVAQKKPNFFGGGKFGRFNANNVDLNRNFDTPSFKSKSVWRFGKNYSESIQVFCGLAPESEPEVKALTSFIQSRNIQTWCTFHNAGSDVMPNSNKRAQELAKAYANTIGFRYIDPDHWNDLGQTGTAAEWTDSQDIAYIEVESSSRWGSDWELQKDAISGLLAML